VTDEIPAAEDLDDAKLLNLVRAGDTDAYGVLYQRHEQAARRLARELVVSPAEIDDVVAETFARVLDVMRLGGGPTDAFRPYVLTAVRRVCYDRLQSQRRRLLTAGRELPDPGDPFVDAAVASLDESLIAQAFMSLPERWSAMLWHTEIERASLAEIAPIFGLTRNGVAALRQRAKEGLRQAYLRMHISKVTRQECRPVAERLGAFVRDALSGRDAVVVSEHLSECDDCQAVCAELSDINSALRGVVAPIFLGSAAASYLASAALGAAAATAGTAPDGAASANAAGPGPVASADAGAGRGGAAAGAPAGGSGLPGVGGSGLPGVGGSGLAGVGGSGGLGGGSGGVLGRASGGGGSRGVLAGAGASAGGVAATGPALGGPAASHPTLGGGPPLRGLAAGGSAREGALVGGAAGGLLASSFGSSTQRGASPPRRASGPLQWIAAAAAIVVAVFAIAFAVTLTGNNSPSGPAHHHPGAAPALSPALVTTSTHSPSPAAKKTPTRTPSAPPVLAPTAAESSSTSPTPPPAPPPPSVELAATVNVSGGHFGNFGQVYFQVTDTGSGQTGELTVSVTLPAGASMVSGGWGGGNGRSATDSGYGWSCQPTSTGGTCQHDAISAGAQTTGAIFFTLSGTSACGQPVQVTATSGAVSASAQSPNGISCST
jgi:RNA polymerase sigma factor (sigma-70 family)